MVSEWDFTGIDDGLDEKRNYPNIVDFFRLVKYYNLPTDDVMKIHGSWVNQLVGYELILWSFAINYHLFFLLMYLLTSSKLDFLPGQISKIHHGSILDDEYHMLW